MMRPEEYRVTDLRGGIPLTNLHLQKKPQVKIHPTQRLLLVVILLGMLLGLLLVPVLAPSLASSLVSSLREMGVEKVLDVLIIPLVVAVTALLLNRSLKMHELSIAEERTQDDAVQAYLDHMATLLTEKKLRQLKPEDEPSICARAGTLLALRRVYPERKRTLLLFLCESGLIRKKLCPNIREHESPVVNLTDADLSEIDLSGCTLPDVVLCHADLSRANLRETSLEDADLRGTHLNGAGIGGADLRGTDLKGADLRGADLTDARNITQEQIDQTVGDKITALPRTLQRPESWSLGIEKQVKCVKEQYGEPQHKGIFRSGK